MIEAVNRLYLHSNLKPSPMIPLPEPFPACRAPAPPSWLPTHRDHPPTPSCTQNCSIKEQSEHKGGKGQKAHCFSLLLPLAAPVARHACHPPQHLPSPAALCTAETRVLTAQGTFWLSESQATAVHCWATAPNGYAYRFPPSPSRPRVYCLIKSNRKMYLLFYKVFSPPFLHLSHCRILLGTALQLCSVYCHLLQWC